MKVFSEAVHTQKGPSDWFSGQAWVDPLLLTDGSPSLRAARVTFSPGVRTAWHKHPHGQAIHVLSGICQAQAMDGPLMELKPGESAWFEPAEVHWHGAKPGYMMCHIAIQAPDDDGQVVTWMEHVTDSQLAAAGVS